MTTSPTPRFCRETRSQLPAYAAGEVTGWPQTVIRAHLRHCRGCAGELEAQRSVDDALLAMRQAPPEPPTGLLDDLLERAADSSVRDRAAVPARGALSGARPTLSVAFLTVGALASTGVGWAAWRGVRAVARGRRNR